MAPFSSIQWSAQIVLQARVQELERLGRWFAEVTESHHLQPRLASRVDLCLTEIVTNCIVHGYSQVTAPEDAVIVRLALLRDQVFCRVEDRGVAFDPLTQPLTPVATTLEDAPVGGSGLRLVHNFADELDYRRESRTNILTIALSG